MKRKLIYLLLALLVCLSLAVSGCNNTPTTDNSNGNGGSEESGGNGGSEESGGDSSGGNDGSDSESGVLVVYFSYSGNTKSVANEIISQSGGVGVEIVPQIPYTAADTNYNDSNSRSQVERREDSRPQISQTETYDKIEMANYQTVIIGYPIWNGIEPMIIRSFIEHYGGLSGKSVHTFSTASSSGGGVRPHKHFGQSERRSREQSALDSFDALGSGKPCR